MSSASKMSWRHSHTGNPPRSGYKASGPPNPLIGISGRNILLLGGNGKVASHLIPWLRNEGYFTIVATNSGESHRGNVGVSFNLMDEDDHNVALTVTKDLYAVYLVGIAHENFPVYMSYFINRAVAKGVKRFVFISSSGIDLTDPLHGEIHLKLSKGKTEWAVLRPTYFMEDILDPVFMRYDRNERRLYHACWSRGVPFVAARDVASVAFRALTNYQSFNTDLILTGPRALTFPEIAVAIGEACRPQQWVECFGLTKEQWIDRLDGSKLHLLIQTGLRIDATHFASLDEEIALGVVELPTNTVRQVADHYPCTLEDFLRSHADML